jgi:hypothetical protein
MLAVILIMFIFLCKKRVFSFISNYEAKKKELNDIVIDAEEMIKELNKFSEYIADQVELKNDEMNRNIKAAEEKAMLLQQRVDSMIISSRNVIKKSKKNKNETQFIAEASEKQIEPKNKEIDPKNEDEKTMTAVNEVDIISSPAILAYTSQQHDAMELSQKKSEKVIPLATKYSKVIKLSQEDMSVQEIAKELNIGKGEVELILDMRR